jgi:hypothetical protein
MIYKAVCLMTLISRFEMNESQSQFLMLLGQLPARLTAEQTAWVLNCQPHDVPVLVAARLLKPLGNPPQNSVKFFAAADVLEQVKDRAWLARVTNTLNQHWQKKNACKKNVAAIGPQNGRAVSANQSLAAVG